MPTTKTISTYQAKQVLDGTHFLQLSAGPCKIFNIEGNTNSTTGTNYYIQLLGTATPVSGTTIPLFSRLAVPSAYATGINGFAFDYQPTGITSSTLTNPIGGTSATAGQDTNGVWVAISSTDTVYTSVAGSTDISVDIEEYELEVPSNQVIIGDLTTAVANLAVFADPSAPNFVYNIMVTNNTGADGYLMLFGKVPANGDIPIVGRTWKLATGTTQTINFGSGGLSPVQADASGTLHTGCYAYGSSTSQTLTATGANWTIQAFYV